MELTAEFGIIFVHGPEAMVKGKRLKNNNRNMRCNRNDPKFLDRLVWANSTDPDRSSLIRVFTFCNTVRIFWMHYSMVKPLFPVLG